MEEKGLRVFSGMFRLNDKMEPISWREICEKERTEGYSEAHRKTVDVCFVWCPICRNVEPIYKFFIKRNGKHFYGFKELGFNELKQLGENSSYYGISDAVLHEYPMLNLREVERKYSPDTSVLFFVAGGCSDALSLECPHCSYQFKKFEKLSTQACLNNRPSIIKYDFYEEGDKLILSIVGAHYLPNLNVKKILVELYKYRVVFNLKSGNTYFMRPLRKHHKKTSTLKVFNATHCNPNESFSWYPCFVNEPNIVRETAQRLIRLHGGKKEQITEDGSYADTDFSMLTAYNKSPYFGYEFYKQSFEHLFSYNYKNLLTYNGFYRKKLIVNRFLATLNRKCSDGGEAVVKYFCRSKVKPKKKLKRMFFNNPINFLYFKMLTRLGFSNIDVITNILTHANDVCNCCFNCLTCRKTQEFSISCFFNSVIKRKGESAAADFFLFYRGDFDDIRNAAEMFAAIDYNCAGAANIVLKGSMETVLKNINNVYDEMRNGNMIIPYSDEERKLESVFDGCSFRLIKDTDEFRNIQDRYCYPMDYFINFAITKRYTTVSVINKGEYVNLIILENNTIDSVINTGAKVDVDCKKTIEKWANEKKISYFRDF